MEDARQGVRPKLNQMNGNAVQFHLGSRANSGSCLSHIMQRAFDSKRDYQRHRVVNDEGFATVAGRFQGPKRPERG